MTNKTLLINRVDCSSFVERDSYETTVQAVYSNSVTTMDGVQHTAMLRVKGEVRFKFNPTTDADTAAIWSALSSLPATVKYTCLQRGADITATMRLSESSAKYLSRCLARGDEWHQIGQITLEEL